jgi:hypothetical protein
MRYFAFTIKSNKSKAGILRQLRRGSYNIFEHVISSIETTPYQHVHVLAATSSPAPEIDRFYALNSQITWEKELEALDDVARYRDYIVAQGRCENKQSGTEFLFVKNAEELANLKP